MVPILLSISNSWSGNTALHKAAENDNVQAVRDLLSFGADRHSRNNFGATPKQLCPQSSRSLQAFVEDASDNTLQSISHAAHEIFRRIDKTTFSPAEKQSKKFFRKGVLDLKEIMLCGFYDPGRSIKEFRKLAVLAENLGPEREIILCDEIKDCRLKDHVMNAERFLQAFKDLEARIKALAMYVSNVMGGSQVEDIKPECNLKGLSKAVCQHVRTVVGRNIVPIGCVTHGVCRHRAILFKYLADRNGIPCRLVKGSYGEPATGHAWNVVYLNSQFYVVDVMHDPTTLYPETSEKARSYTRVNVTEPVVNGTCSQELQRPMLSLERGNSPKLGIGGSSLPHAGGMLCGPAPPPARERYVPLPDFKTATIVFHEQLGSGTYGQVHRCTIAGFTCAVKSIERPITLSKHENDILDREVTILESMSHKNIVTYLGHEIREKTLRLFMEYIPHSLHSCVVQQQMTNRPFAMTHIAEIALGVARGLKYLHSMKPPIVHRDIKCNNVLVSLSEGPKRFPRVALCDFGVSKVVAGTACRTVVGTPGFIAPEVIGNQSNAAYTEKADIWSYGVLLNNVLTLELPRQMMQIQNWQHKGNHSSKKEHYPGALPKIPDALRGPYQPIINFIDACTRVDPKSRPSATEIVVALTDLGDY